VSLGLYLHIPFCQSICSYCNFNRGLLDRELKRRYVDALEREIRGRGVPAPLAADTIFFGGGTPSLLEPDEVARLVQACRDTFVVDPRAEVTLETNPETVSPERLSAFKAAGVTRLSLGVQSLNDDELARLGRIHSADRAKAAVRTAKATGFESVSFDLMFWLPGQSLSSWMTTIEDAIALDPDHLSLYLLELYPNAPLKETMARMATAGRAVQGAAATSRGGPVVGVTSADWAQASDDDAADMYLAALERLDAAGFQQYEISNVARSGRISRHNVKYWQAGDWIGFGCGAHSTIDGVRWKNVSATSDYVDRVDRGLPTAVERQHLTREARLEEALFTGLRLSAGVDGAQMLATHGVDVWERYGAALQPYVDDGLMWVAGTRFGLTRAGMIVANEILTTFV